MKDYNIAGLCFAVASIAITALLVLRHCSEKSNGTVVEQQYSRAAEFCATQPGMVDCVREVVKVCQ